MTQVAEKIEKLGGTEKVRINMIKYSSGCDNDLTEALLDDISKDISINIQKELDKRTETNSVDFEDLIQKVNETIYLSHF